MSSTNRTKNYGLPQWLPDDHPTWQEDVNGAFSKIDETMKSNENQISAVETKKVSLSQNDSAVTISVVDKEGNQTVTIQDKSPKSPTALTNQNLNSVSDLGWYYAGDSNTVSNKPDGIDAFGMVVFKSSINNVSQMVVSSNLLPDTVWVRNRIRAGDGTSSPSWSGWKKLGEQDSSGTETETIKYATVTCDMWDDGQLAVK